MKTLVYSLDFDYVGNYVIILVPKWSMWAVSQSVEGTLPFSFSLIVISFYPVYIIIYYIYQFVFIFLCSLFLYLLLFITSHISEFSFFHLCLSFSFNYCLSCLMPAFSFHPFRAFHSLIHPSSFYLSCSFLTWSRNTFGKEGRHIWLKDNKIYKNGANKVIGLITYVVNENLRTCDILSSWLI